MASSPAFAATPRASAATISTAESSRTAPTNVGTVWTAGTAGSRIERVIIEATGTTTAGMVRLFLYNGSTYFLFAEVSVSAITPSGTVAAFNAPLSFALPGLELFLPNGWSLRATTQNAESFNVIAFGGDF